MKNIDYKLKVVLYDFLYITLGAVILGVALVVLDFLLVIFAAGMS